MYRELRARELDPGGRLAARVARGGNASSSRNVSVSRQHDAGLRSWAESDALRHCRATYSELRPAPRSTIAASYSPDGTLLASTHGDHTVKLIDCRTGRCVTVLTGHRRTPWVVRFHPKDGNVLVSGSLDHQVRVWNATSAECILCFDFGKPIASLAFNADGDTLAVASGHKLYAWRYKLMPQWDERRASRDAEVRNAAHRDAAAAVAAHENAVAQSAQNTTIPPLPPFIATFPQRGRGSTSLAAARMTNADGQNQNESETASISAPCIALRTRRSLRAVHFHPHQGHWLLSAEVNETSDHDVPPLRALTNPNKKGEWETAYAAASAAATAAVGDTPTAAAAASAAATAAMDEDCEGSVMNMTPSGKEEYKKKSASTYVYVAPRRVTETKSDLESEIAFEKLRVQSPGSVFDMETETNMDIDDTVIDSEPVTEEEERRAAETAAAAAVGDVLCERRRASQRNAGRIDSRHRRRRVRNAEADAGEENVPFTQASATAAAVVYHSAWSIGGIRVVGPDGRPTRSAASLDAATAAAAAATSAAAAAGAEQPCTVKLRLWPHDPKDPLHPLKDARLTIPHAVLCSEMGAHFSPCGRRLAVCAACVPISASAPLPGEQIPDLVYELRVYSLDNDTFGEVLCARAIRAAHCLTSVQFSPDGSHVMVAYGRRHSSLLLLVADGNRCVTVHTVLETYDSQDMRLTRSLASAEDEVNVACFHPKCGGGLTYGTKEGKLRMLRHDKPSVVEADEDELESGEKQSRDSFSSANRPTAIGRCLQDELREVLEWSEDEGSGDGRLDDGSEDGSDDRSDHEA